MMKTLVCCIAKLENHYIREWVEHYKQLGFNNVVIYDNNDIYGEHFEDVISYYIESGYIKIQDYRGQKSACNSASSDSSNLQIKAYRDAYSRYSDEFDWILFVDADEFLMLESASNILEFLSDPLFNDVNAIKFCWKYFDDNDLIYVINNDYSLVNRFTHHNTTGHQNNQGKCILRTKQNIIINSAHCFGGRNATNSNNVKCVSPVGEHENINGPFVSSKQKYKGACLNHYRYKTIQEYVELKCNRLYPDQSPNCAKRILQPTSFFNSNKKTKEKEDFIHNPQKLDKLTQLKQEAEQVRTNPRFIEIFNSFNSPINRRRLLKKI